MRKFLIVIMVLFLTACGTGVHAPVETNEGDDTMSNEKWLFDVETEQNDNELLVRMLVTNNQEQEASLDFSSGQKYEILLKNEAGEVEYRYSEGMMFTMALIHEPFEAGETKVYEERIALDSISAGSYVLEAELVLAGTDLNDELFKKQVSVEIN